MSRWAKGVCHLKTADLICIN